MGERLNRPGHSRWGMRLVTNGTTSQEVDIRPLWRVSVDGEPEEGEEKPCLMRNSPLEMFICEQIASCPLECSQKVEQEANQDFVFRNRLKMRMLVERTMQRAGDARRG